MFPRIGVSQQSENVCVQRCRLAAYTAGEALHRASGTNERYLFKFPVHRLQAELRGGTQRNECLEVSDRLQSTRLDPNGLRTIRKCLRSIDRQSQIYSVKITYCRWAFFESFGKIHRINHQLSQPRRIRAPYHVLCLNVVMPTLQRPA